MKPLLTVVIPVYNVEKYLKRCVENKDDLMLNIPLFKSLNQLNLVIF